MKQGEFRETLRLLEANEGNYDMQAKFPAMKNFQFRIICQADDITNLETNDLRSHSTFGNFALETRVSWSKNAERVCADQIMLGANDTDFCVLLLATACLLAAWRAGFDIAPAGTFLIW